MVGLKVCVKPAINKAIFCIESEYNRAILRYTKNCEAATLHLAFMLRVRELVAMQLDGNGETKGPYSIPDNVSAGAPLPRK